MTEQEQLEEVREGIEDTVGGWFLDHKVVLSLAPQVTAQILSLKVGNHTLEELIELALKASEEDGLVIKCKEQSLPNMVFYCGECKRMVKNTMCNIVDEGWVKTVQLPFDGKKGVKNA